MGKFTYPRIKIPDQFSEIQNLDICVKSSQEEKPEKPSYFDTLIVLSILSVVVYFLFYFISNIFLGGFENVLVGLILFGITLLASLIFYLKNLFNFKKRDKVYSYYFNAISKIRTQEETEKYRKLKKEIFLFNTKRPTQKLRQKKGRSETFFYPYLMTFFPDKIYTDYIIEQFSNGNSYQPDFILQDKETNLHIDIEIDEPYSLEDKRPIHYFKNGYNQVEKSIEEEKRIYGRIRPFKIHSDYDRDNYFSNLNWFVIRFSEEQVMRYPESCCKVVAEILTIATGNKDWLLKFKDVPDLIPIDCWSENDAIEFSKNNYREKYLTKQTPIAYESRANDTILLSKNKYVERSISDYWYEMDDLGNVKFVEKKVYSQYELNNFEFEDELV